MKIAQIAPLYEAVPPKLYGGTEMVIAHLCDALTDSGHDVTLFASAESSTEARLVPMRDHSLRLDAVPLKSDLAAHLSMLYEVRELSHRFDILHFHLDLLHFPLFEHVAHRCVTPIHSRTDLKDLPGAYARAQTCGSRRGGGHGWWRLNLEDRVCCARPPAGLRKRTTASPFGLREAATLVATRTGKATTIPAMPHIHAPSQRATSTTIGLRSRRRPTNTGSMMWPSMAASSRKLVPARSVLPIPSNDTNATTVRMTKVVAHPR